MLYSFEHRLKGGGIKLSLLEREVKIEPVNMCETTIATHMAFGGEALRLSKYPAFLQLLLTNVSTVRGSCPWPLLWLSVFYFPHSNLFIGNSMFVFYLFHSLSSFYLGSFAIFIIIIPNFLSGHPFHASFLHLPLQVMLLLTGVTFYDFLMYL
jgi:hypothetical protein